MTIYKYPLPSCRITLALPRGAEILAAGVQLHGVVLWARVDPSQPLSERRVAIMLTGEEMPDGRWGYVQTLNSLETGIVLHVFIEEPTP